jgi:2'-5' RNA ligase
MQTHSRDEMTDAAPLILTAAFDEASFAMFNRLRQQHFPPERNFIDAHLTLFHALPPQKLAGIIALMTEMCAAEPPIAARVTGLMSLGRGTAFRIEAEALSALRNRLKREFEGDLNAQDRQGFLPHVTIQNKVTPAEAKALQAQLTASFVPFDVEIAGLDLWHYEGGPWRLAHAARFTPTVS